MADEIRKYTLQVEADTKQADNNLSDFQKTIITTNQAVQLFKSTVSDIKSAFSSVASIVERGQQIDELSNSFRALGGTSQELNKLTQATDGLISNLDLLKTRNQAIQAGLNPEQFLELASAADALGDTIGNNTNVELQELVDALTKGNDRSLQAIGIKIDNAKAEANYAATIGKSAAQLNEIEKREAARIEILDQIKGKVKELGGSSDTAGDNLQRFFASISNAKDYFSSFINNSKGVVFVFKEIADFAENAAISLKYYLSSDLEARTARKFAEVERLQAIANLSKDSFFVPDSIERARQADADKAREELVKLQEESRKLNSIKKESKEISHENAAALAAETDKAKEQALAFKDLTNSLEVDKLKSGIDKLFSDFPKSFNATQFDDYFTKYKEAYKKTIIESETAKNEIALKQGQVTVDQINDYAIQQTELVSAEIAQQLQDKSEEAFQNVVEFFIDTLSSADQYADFEDTMKDVLKRLAIGFAAQIAANVATSQFGLNLSGITSASGLGQSIAASLGFGGGGVQGLSSIFGAGASAAGGGLFSGALSGGGAGVLLSNGSIISASAAVPDGLSAVGSASLPSAFSAASLQTIGAGIGAAMVGYFSAQGLSSALKGNKLSVAEQAALAIPTFGASFLFNPVKDFFSGDSQKSAEREAREAFLEKVFKGNLSFQGAGGLKTLDAKNFNLDTSGFGGQAAGLISPLATLLTGGNGKLKDDVTGIFANAIKEGKSFNEVLISGQALLKQTGINANQAKQDFTQLFLQGKIGLEDFSEGIKNLNILASDNLVGKNSVKDAIAVLEDSTTNVGEKIHAVGLAFTELAEDGIDSFSEIHNYLTENATPEIVKAFDDIQNAGINSFEEIANATPDQIVIIANAIKTFLKTATENFNEFSDTVGNTTEAGVKRAASAIRGLRQTAETEGSKIKKALTIRAEISYQEDKNPNQSLNPRVS